MSNEKWLSHLTPQTGLQDAVRQIWGQRSARVRELLHVLLATDSPDQRVIHQARVAVRRLQGVLDVFHALLPRTRCLELAESLRELRQRAGQTRNLDVFSKFLERATSQDADDLSSQEDWGHIRRHFEVQRQRALDRLKRRLPNLMMRIEPLLLAVDQKLNKDQKPNKPLKQRESAKSSGTLGNWACAILPELTCRFWKKLKKLADRPDQFHKLRIAGKEYRYALEMFAPLLGEDFQTTWYPQWEHLQELLGELQDTVVAQKLLNNLAEERTALVPQEETTKSGRRARKRRLDVCIEKLSTDNQRRRQLKLLEFHEFARKLLAPGVREQFLSLVKSLEKSPDMLTMKEDSSATSS